MRVTSLLRKLLAVTSLFVENARWEGHTLVAQVRPRWRKPRCGECGRRGPQYDRQAPRRWRALSYGTVRVSLEYALRRVTCRACDGVRVEQVPWAARGSWFTHSFEELVAYMAQVTDKTAVTKLMGMSWEAVGNIVQRVVDSRMDANRLHAVRRIGVDEFSYRKRHRYLTVVVDHDAGRVIWCKEGRGADTLRAFFDELGQEGVERLESITMDMSGGYMKAVKDRVPKAKIVFDHFHVQKLAGDALDEVRREMWRSLKGTDEGKAIKGMRFVLLKKRWNLHRHEYQRLYTLQYTNKRLYRAYLLKDVLSDALTCPRPEDARKTLEDWLAWASRSKLKPFVRVARTIRENKEGVLAYVTERLTNGIVEGFNNRLRMVARRAFGFHSPEPLIAMYHLCAGRIALNPPLP